MFVNANWTAHGNAARIELSLSTCLLSVFLDKNFKFQGPGFYLYARTTILIIPCLIGQQPPSAWWKRTWPADQTFEAYVWERNHSETIFAHCVAAPTRWDERD
jgi:hypothetical protein